MSKVDYSAEAELFPARRGSARGHVGYKRFPSAALAIQYAIEHLPSELLLGSFLEFGEERFGAEGIRKLYENNHYPFARAEKAKNMKPTKSSAWLSAEARLDLSKQREPDLKREQRQAYEATALKTRRLRDLRLAKEAAEKEAASEAPAQPPAGPTTRRSRQI